MRIFLTKRSVVALGLGLGLVACGSSASGDGVPETIAVKACPAGELRYPAATVWPKGADFAVAVVAGARAEGSDAFAFGGRGLFAPLFAGDSATVFCLDGSGAGPRVPAGARAADWDTLDFSGEWTEDRKVDSGLHVVLVSGTVPPGRRLVLNAGASLFFAEATDLVVAGELQALGTAAAPVVLTALAAERPWGGLLVQGEASLYETFLTAGGGNADRNYGHSNSHPVLDCAEGTVRADHVQILHNAGKGIGGVACDFTLENSLVAWSDMGGEFHDGQVHIRRSALMFFPDTTDSFRDDDNDAIYILAFQPPTLDSVWSTIDSSVLYHGQDDGVDHNGALLRIRDSRISHFAHEGLAASQMGVADIGNTLVEECEQGIEAGYGAPLLLAQGLLLRNNQIGARLGDSYPDQEHKGTLRVENTAFANNGVDVLNDPGTLNAPDSLQVVIRNSQLRSGALFQGFGNVQPAETAYNEAGQVWPHAAYSTGPAVELWDD